MTSHAYNRAEERGDVKKEWSLLRDLFWWTMIAFASFSAGYLTGHVINYFSVR